MRIPPTAPPRRRGKDRSDRPPAGQSGHQEHGRELLPAWAVDELIEHWPASCDCGHVFAAAEQVACREPARHQVEELQIAVRVTEHRCQRLRCPDCGVERSGELPAEVAGSAFGPCLQAAVVALSVRNRVSRRDLVELCEELFGARISVGSIDAILARAGEALEQPYEHLLSRMRRPAASNGVRCTPTQRRARRYNRGHPMTRSRGGVGPVGLVPTAKPTAPVY